MEKLASELGKIDSQSKTWILGADFNMIPPGSDKTDYCIDDKCDGESFHNTGDEPFHKDGSNYGPDTVNLNMLYSKYYPDIPLNKYTAKPADYYSYIPAHTQKNYVSDEWRKLDFLFSNHNWIENTEITHQDCLFLSDHVPVTKLMEIKK
jgi:endonuclease/exonuclease/phosphatase family metal-dependent hydrolase